MAAVVVVGLENISSVPNDVHTGFHAQQSVIQSNGGGVDLRSQIGFSLTCFCNVVGLIQTIAPPHTQKTEGCLVRSHKEGSKQRAVGSACSQGGFLLPQ